MSSSASLDQLTVNSMDAASGSNPLLQLVPMLVISVIYGAIAISIGRRKVRNLALWTILCIIPFVNFFAVLFLISKTDIKVLNEITNIRPRLEAIESRGA
jgi:hypothetical protein